MAKIFVSGLSGRSEGNFTCTCYSLTKEPKNTIFLLHYFCSTSKDVCVRHFFELSSDVDRFD